MKPSIPNFKILRRIGKGGFGEVWLAESVTNKRRAVKYVRRQHFERPGLSRAGVDALFRLEFEGVKHFEDLAAVTPELISIHVVGKIEIDDAYYYVMPLADNADGSEEGGWEDYKPLTLEAWVDVRGAMTWDQSISLIATVARGAAALHREGLQHGDITSANVLFVGGQSVLADPGLTSLAGTQEESRSPGYSELDGGSERSRDVFALGRMFYHAVSGKHPAESFPVIPADRMAEIPMAPFAEFLDRCCDPDSDRRFDSSEALLNWLSERFPDQAGSGVDPAPPARRWTLPIATAALLIAGGALWVWFAWPEKLPFHGLPTRGVVGAIDHLPERSVWRYAIVESEERDEPIDEWRSGRGPFHFGPHVRELPQKLSFVEGKSGSALHFDQEDAGVHSVDGYVELPPVTGDFTIAMWVRWDGDPATTHHGCAWSVGILPEPHLRLTINNWGGVYPIYNGEEVETVSLEANAVDMSDRQWRHLAVTVSDRVMRFYVDGKAQGEGEFSQEIGFIDAPQFLGFHQWVVGQSTRFWGALDEVCWVPRPLGPQEIAALAKGVPVDVSGGILLPMEGSLDEDGDGIIGGVYGRSGGGDDGTRVRAETEGYWLRMEKEFVLSKEIAQTIATMDSVGVVKMLLDGERVELKDDGASRPGHVYEEIDLGRLAAGQHKIQLWLSPGDTSRAARLGLRF